MNGGGKSVDFIESSVWRVAIGERSEIGSISVIRPYALDTVVVFWEGYLSSKSKEIFSCSQRLLIVVDEDSLSDYMYFYE